MYFFGLFSLNSQFGKMSGWLDAWDSTCKYNVFLEVMDMFIFLIGELLIYNVLLVSGVHQSESVIHIHIATLF